MSLSFLAFGLTFPTQIDIQLSPWKPSKYAPVSILTKSPIFNYFILLGIPWTTSLLMLEQILEGNPW